MAFQLTNNGNFPRALYVDLDGTLLHPEPARFQVKGRSGSSYFSEKSAELLFNISGLAPVVIATGRSALSVKKFTDQISDIHFSGFILENGLVARDSLYVGQKRDDRWRYVLQRVPDWEVLKGYENCLGLVPPEGISDPVEYIRRIVIESGVECLIYPERYKIFLYPQKMDKTSGLAFLKMDPFIALGNETNDMQMLSISSYPVTLQSSCSQIQELVKRKNGYCSSRSSHSGTEDMLDWVYRKLQLSGF